MAQALLAGADVLKCIHTAICWENIILHSHPEKEISFKFIPNILMSKECIHFLGHSVYIYIHIREICAIIIGTSLVYLQILNT